jgi:hypothetical protein
VGVEETGEASGEIRDWGPSARAGAKLVTKSTHAAITDQRASACECFLMRLFQSLTAGDSNLALRLAFGIPGVA